METAGGCVRIAGSLMSRLRPASRKNADSTKGKRSPSLDRLGNWPQGCTSIADTKDLRPGFKPIRLARIGDLMTDFASSNLVIRVIAMPIGGKHRQAVHRRSL